jgi:hypothetical protein
MFYVSRDWLDSDVVEAVQRVQQPHLLESNCGWLTELVATVKGCRNDSLVDTLAYGLRQHYGTIILFHGCRPVSLESYQKHGLCPSDTGAITKQAKSLFGPEPAFDQALQSVGHAYRSYNHGKTFLCVTKESYWRSPAHHQHYLEHGSEFLSGLANRCGREDTIRSIGVPVVIECSVHSSELPLDFWPSLAGAILWDWANRLWQPRKRTSDSTLCTTVERPIPPDRIRFHHFKEIRKLITVRSGLDRDAWEIEKVRFQPLREPAKP